MSWLGQIRPHRRDESWSTSLWQTFVSTSMGAQIPVIAENPLATCGCRKFQLDPLGDHLNTCTGHSDLFRTTDKVKTHQVVKSRGHHCGDIELTEYLANESGPVPFQRQAVPGPDPGIRRRTQIGMFRPIQMDHTNCLQVDIKTFHSFIGAGPPDCS